MEATYCLMCGQETHREEMKWAAKRLVDMIEGRDEETSTTSIVSQAQWVITLAYKPLYKCKCR